MARKESYGENQSFFFMKKILSMCNNHIRKFTAISNVKVAKRWPCMYDFFAHYTSCLIRFWENFASKITTYIFLVFLFILGLMLSVEESVDFAWGKHRFPDGEEVLQQTTEASSNEYW